jgi:hypothetical protein
VIKTPHDEAPTPALSFRKEENRLRLPANRALQIGRTRRRFSSPGERAGVRAVVLHSRADIETFVHLGEQISHYEAVETRYAIKMPASSNTRAD